MMPSYRAATSARRAGSPVRAVLAAITCLSRSGVQHRDAPLLLIPSHRAGHLHPAQEQLYQLGVDRVDLPAVSFQFGHVPLSSFPFQKRPYSPSTAQAARAAAASITGTARGTIQGS